jgi:hypothetical protein
MGTCGNIYGMLNKEKCELTKVSACFRGVKIIFVDAFKDLLYKHQN